MKKSTRKALGIPIWPTNGIPIRPKDENVILEFIKTGNKTESYRKFYTTDKKSMSPIQYFRLPLVVNFLKEYCADLPHNDSVVDDKLLQIITTSQDEKSVVAAIKEYNRIRSRIIETISINKNDFDTSKLTDSDLESIVSAMIKKTQENVTE